jgi:hypothetical protein
MTATLLSKAYPSILARPVIRAVDPSIFRLRYFRHCLACTFCADQCCDHGVDIDRGNVSRLLGLGKAFEDFVGTPAASWFEAGETADHEFPSGAHTRTRTRDGHCVFRAKSRGCLIHAYCAQNGLDYHALKPLVSILFPLTFENGVLVPSNEVTQGTLVCAKGGATLYEGAREELAYFFGEDFVVELDACAISTCTDPS